MEIEKVWFRENNQIGLSAKHYLVLEDVKIADTPQELIQVGDLVETDIYPLLPVTEVLNDLHINCYCEKFIRVKDGCNITKIYTPNEDKSVYTLQWEQTKIWY